MIFAQEVAEHDFRPLPEETKGTLSEIECNRCNENLTNKDRIHYLATSNGRVLWWHDECIAVR